MIEYLEADLTGNKIYASNPDNSAVAEEANYDEAIIAVSKAKNDTEMYLEEEHNGCYIPR